MSTIRELLIEHGGKWEKPDDASTILTGEEIIQCFIDNKEEGDLNRHGIYLNQDDLLDLGVEEGDIAGEGIYDCGPSHVPPHNPELEYCDIRRSL